MTQSYDLDLSTLESPTPETVAHEAERYVALLGLPKPPKPAQEWQGLTNEHGKSIGIADCTDRDLGRNMAELAGWIAYTQYQLALVDNGIPATEFLEARHKATLFLKLKGAKVNGEKAPTEKEIEANITLDNATKHYGLQLYASEARRRLLRALLDGYQQWYSALSRQVSARGGLKDGAM